MAENNLPTLSAPRLPWHPVFADEYGIDEGAWRALVEGIFPAAQTLDAIRLALSYCRARRLDVFKRVVHIVPIWSASQKKFVETIWPGIAELRTTAYRTTEMAGCDDALFGETATGTWIERRENDRRQVVETEHTVVYPTWAQVTVYRLDRTGTPRAVRGPRVLWMETYSRVGRGDVPNDRWRRAPWQMLEKCAEAAALRRAFPEELGDSFTDDESGTQAARAMVDVTPPTAPPPQATSAPTTGNAGLRERLAAHLEDDDRPSSPAKVADAILQAEGVAAKAQGKPEEAASPSGVLGQAENRDAHSTGSAAAGSPAGGRGEPPPGSETGEIEIIVPVKKGRSFDWADYAEQYIAAGKQMPVDRLGIWRGRQAAMFEGLHQARPEDWARANQALAEYEREGREE